MTKESMNAYGYGRASTDGQTITLDAQRDKVKAYCEFKGLHLVEFIEDPATSSRLPISEREGGRRLCDLVRSGDKVQAIVVAKLDRAWRSAAECLNTVDEWEKRGADLHLLDIGVSVDTPPGRLFLTIMAAVAEMERAMISERTSTALRHAQANGKRVSSRPPYGWEDDHEGPVNSKGLPVKIRPCAKEKAILADMIRRKGEGMTPARIAAALNKAGTVQRNGKPWVRQSIAKILARSSAFAQDQYR